MLEIQTGDRAWTPIASSPLALDGGFSFAAANLPSDPSAVCRPTVRWGVYDPAVVSEIRLDGGPFDHGTGSGNPAFGGGTLFFRTKLCNVDPGIHHLAGYDANGDLVTAQVPIVPMDAPA